MRGDLESRTPGRSGRIIGTGGWAPRWRRRVSRMWAMEPAPRASRVKRELDGGGELLRPIVVEERE